MIRFQLLPVVLLASASAWCGCRVGSTVARAPTPDQLEAPSAVTKRVGLFADAPWDFESPGVKVRVVNGLADREHPWLVDWWGLNRPVSSSLAWADDRELRAKVSASRGLTGTEVEFRITCDENGAPRVAARVSYWDDSSAPTSWTAPIGHVDLSVSPWRDGVPRNFSGLMLGFDLSDLSAAHPQHVQGLVHVER